MFLDGHAIAFAGVATRVAVRYRISMAFGEKVLPNPVCLDQSQTRRDTLGRVSLAVIVAIAFATRVSLFGNPVIQVDEQFYLLSGDRLIRGALSFVDLCDRKPLDSFPLYPHRR